jgi:hypothetical protein
MRLAEGFPMLRIYYTTGIAALLLLQASASFAAERNHEISLAPSAEPTDLTHETSDEVYQTAASAIREEGNASSDAALQQQAGPPEPASNAMTMEYPALALLAMAIISMAALSRRDSLRIDQ